MTQTIATIQGSRKANSKTAQVTLSDNGQVTVTWSDGNDVRFASRSAYNAWTSFNPYIQSITSKE